MFQGLVHRVRFYRDSLRPWWILVFALWTLFSNAAFLRDEFLPLDIQKKWSTLAILPEWGWQTWLIGVLAILLFFAMEGSYRKWEREHRRVENLEAQLRQARTVPVVSSVFIVQHLEHTFYWRDEHRGLQAFHPEVVAQSGAQRVMQVQIRIEAPSMLVEYIGLEIMGQRLQSDWKARRLDAPHWQYVYLDIPQSVNPGPHIVRLIARTHDKESPSLDFEISVPHT